MHLRINMLYESELKRVILLLSSKENSTVLNILYEQMPITLLFFYVRSHCPWSNHRLTKGRRRKNRDLCLFCRAMQECLLVLDCSNCKSVVAFFATWSCSLKGHYLGYISLQGTTFYLCLWDTFTFWLLCAITSLLWP